MLERDYYLEDVTKQYYPNTSLNELLSRLYKPALASNQSLFQHDELVPFINAYNTAGMQRLAILVASLLPILFYRKIPGLNRLSNWQWRLPISLGILLLPSVISTGIVNEKHTKMAEELCYKKRKKFRRYQLSGDIRKINPTVKLVELPEPIN